MLYFSVIWPIVVLLASSAAKAGKLSSYLDVTRSELDRVNHYHGKCSSSFSSNHTALVQSIQQYNEWAASTMFNSPQLKSKHRISIVTYFTDSIEHYAAYSLYINYVWATYIHDYRLIIVNQSYATAHGLVEPRDERWNKVRILRHFMSETHPRFKSLSQSTIRDDTCSDYSGLCTTGAVDNSDVDTSTDHYLVWMDADLVVLNLNMGLEQNSNGSNTNSSNQIASGFHIDDIVDCCLSDTDTGVGAVGAGACVCTDRPEVYISRDMEAAPFVANTGMVIVRNSNWSRRFLDEWWERFDRGACCDQHALNWLYHGAPASPGKAGGHIPIIDDGHETNQVLLTPIEVRARVRVLPSTALGTDFPAYAHQQSKDPVLHLAGQSDLLSRRVAFQQGAVAVCTALNKYKDSLHRTLVEGEMEMQTVQAVSVPYPTFPHQLGLTRQYLRLLALINPCRQLTALRDIVVRVTNSRFGTSNVNSSDSRSRDSSRDAPDTLSWSPSDADTEYDSTSKTDIATIGRRVHDAYSVERHWNRVVRGRLVDVLKQGREMNSYINTLLAVQGMTGTDDIDNDNVIDRLVCDEEECQQCLVPARRAVVIDLVRQQQLKLLRVLSHQFLALADYTVKAALNPLLREDSNKSDAEVSSDDESRGYQQHRLRHLVLMGLEILKEAFSTAVEFTLERQQQSNTTIETDNDKSLVGVSVVDSHLSFLRRLDECVLRPFVDFAVFVDEDSKRSDSTASKFQSAGPKVVSVRATALYYQFKLHQLIASEHQRALTSPQWSHVHDAVSGALEIAAGLWERMAVEYRYFGSGYVMADPYKEGYELHSQLGGLQCLTPVEPTVARERGELKLPIEKKYGERHQQMETTAATAMGTTEARVRDNKEVMRMEQGAIHLARSLFLRKLTLSGYSDMNIATESIITAEMLALLETYSVALKCLNRRLLLLQTTTTTGERTHLCELAQEYSQNATDRVQELRQRLGLGDAGDELTAAVSDGIDRERLERATDNLIVSISHVRFVCTVAYERAPIGEKSEQQSMVGPSTKTTSSVVRWRRKKKRKDV